ncbi:GTP-binding protein [Thermus tenuipuniceus]|uniref:GTP-binding protein n=1 Tax=Thermus tenuipuniceus TaxID=2078690 RepID=UPI000CFA69A6|nr:GTP-binding protein [Thermus tenuipuniceus]
MEDRLPVTLITGFLGVGKTTLVNRLLREREGLFVLVNEFGEVPLDHRLVEGRAEALAEGCLCCGLEGELVAALAPLHRRGGFHHLLLETSGLAHPAPILRVLLSPGVREAYRLAGVVALVDPLHLDLYLAFPEVRAQIRYADLLLLTKADRAEPEILEGAEEAVRALNPLAPLRRVAKGEGVDPEEVLYRLVPDEETAIQGAVLALLGDGCRLLLTGGTGPAPRDRTPEAVLPLVGQGLPWLRGSHAPGLPAGNPHGHPLPGPGGKPGEGLGPPPPRKPPGGPHLPRGGVGGGAHGPAAFRGVRFSG